MKTNPAFFAMYMGNWKKKSFGFFSGEKGGGEEGVLAVINHSFSKLLLSKEEVLRSLNPCRSVGRGL